MAAAATTARAGSQPAPLVVRADATVLRASQGTVLAEARAVERTLVREDARRGRTRSAGSVLAGIATRDGPGGGGGGAAAAIAAIAYLPGIAGFETGCGAVLSLESKAIGLWATAEADGPHTRAPRVTLRGTVPLPYDGGAALAVVDGGRGLLVATEAGVVFCAMPAVGHWAFGKPQPSTQQATQVVALDVLAGGEGGGAAWAAAVGAAVAISSGAFGRPPTVLPMPAPVTALQSHGAHELVAGDAQGRITVVDARTCSHLLSFGAVGLRTITSLQSDGQTVTCGSSNGEVTLWDVRQAAHPLRRVLLDGAEVTAVRLAHNKRFYAVATKAWTYWIDAASPTLAPVPCIPPKGIAGGPEPWSTDLAWNAVWNIDTTRPPCFHAAQSDGTLATYLLTP